MDEICSADEIACDGEIDGFDFTVSEANDFIKTLASIMVPEKIL